MRLFVLALLIAAVYGGVWEQYKSDYSRTFATPEQEATARDCFDRNLRLIAERNARGEERHGLNQFTDMCPEEFKAKFLNMKVDTTRTKDLYPLFSQRQVEAAANSSVDWRTRGAVTPVKNQAQCGSCWAFSSTGNMEGQWFLAGNTLVSLSEQELVSCSGSAGNQGCNGGLMDNAFKWVIQKGGITSEANYPYTSGSGITGQCNTAKETPIAATFTSYKDIAQNEDQMAAFVATGGPLAIAVDASSGWQTYTGGIMKSCSGRQLDHGVLIVGYGVEGSTPYWIVKNSWAAGWGEQGYIRLQRGTDQCGLTQAASTSIAGSGPAPTPSPQPTPTPAPTPSGNCDQESSFTQAQCVDSGCLLCERLNFPTNQCVPDTSGGAVQVCCDSDGQNLVEKVYTSADCSDTPTTKEVPLNQCLRSSSGGYFKNICGGGNKRFMRA